MKTSNRPTASNRPPSAPAAGDIAALAHRVRGLWATGLWDQPEEHEATTLVLMDLELDLERLSLRRLADTFSAADASELERCRHLVTALERERARRSALARTSEFDGSLERAVA